MSSRVTISDVAREAGVSNAAVSAVLNDKGSISEPTRARIMAACEKLNYRPSSRARLRSERSVRKSIGLVIKELDNPYFMEVAAGAMSEARKHGYSILIASSEGEYELEKEAVALMSENGVSGLVINPLYDRDADLAHLFELRRRNLPFVLLEDVRGMNGSLVDIENRQASREAVEHLLSLGHQRIVHFAGPEYSTHADERVVGLHQAFSHSPWPVPEEAIVPAGARLEDGYRVGLEYFRARTPGQRPTAVTCYNDLVAIGLIRALHELGLSVPADVSVIGFDDLGILDYYPVGLTTVHVPRFDMGRRSVELLIRHVEADQILPPVKEHLPGRLVVRGSTGRPAESPAPSRKPRAGSARTSQPPTGEHR